MRELKAPTFYELRTELGERLAELEERLNDIVGKFAKQTAHNTILIGELEEKLDKANSDIDEIEAGNLKAHLMLKGRLDKVEELQGLLTERVEKLEGLIKLTKLYHEEDTTDISSLERL